MTRLATARLPLTIVALVALLIAMSISASTAAARPSLEHQTRGNIQSVGKVGRYLVVDRKVVNRVGDGTRWYAYIKNLRNNRARSGGDYWEKDLNGSSGDTASLEMTGSRVLRWSTNEFGNQSNEVLTLAATTIPQLRSNNPSATDVVDIPQFSICGFYEHSHPVNGRVAWSKFVADDGLIDINTCDGPEASFKQPAEIGIYNARTKVTKQETHGQTPACNVEISRRYAALQHADVKQRAGGDWYYECPKIWTIYHRSSSTAKFSLGDFPAGGRTYEVSRILMTDGKMVAVYKSTDGQRAVMRVYVTATGAMVHSKSVPTSYQPMLLGKWVVDARGKKLRGFNRWTLKWKTLMNRGRTIRKLNTVGRWAVWVERSGGNNRVYTNRI